MLVPRTGFVSRHTLGAERAESRPYDGFALTEKGQSWLSLHELAHPSRPLDRCDVPLPKSILNCLRAYDLHRGAGGGDVDGSDAVRDEGEGEGEGEGEDEDEDEDEGEEEDERRLPHAGYTRAIRAPPAQGMELSKGEAVAVYYAPPHGELRHLRYT